MPVVARLALLALASLLALAPPASARITAKSGPLISDNITPLFTVPGVHPIGARIRGDVMYVTGPEGLTVFDVSDPEMPLPMGALPLPHFENEDVDLGGNVLLISNDPSEGVGILYVIDISDPSQPSILSATPNDVIDFCQACLDIFEIPASETVPPGTGHTASCIHECQYAYLAGTGHGIGVWDLRDPAAPKLVKFFVPEITGGLATHDVQVDSDGLAWIVGYQGTAAYDVTDPENPKLVMRSDPAVSNTGVAQPGGVPPSLIPTDDHVITVDEPITETKIPVAGGKGDSPLDFIHHDSLRFPKPAAVPPAETPGTTPPAADPGADGDPGTFPGGPAAEQPKGDVKGEQRRSVPKKKKAKKKVRCNRYRSKAKRRRCYKRRRAAQKRARVRARSSAVSAPVHPAGGAGDIVGIVEEDYTRPTCEGAGSFQTWKITDRLTTEQKDDQGNVRVEGGKRILEMQDLWMTEVQALPQGSGFAPVAGVCSAHYFDQRDGLVANGWYEEGTRFLDVSDPKDIKQVGYWIPAKGETWSAIFAPGDKTGQTIYALDVVRGIEVLHIDRTKLDVTPAPVRRSWVRRARSASKSALARFRTGFSKKSRYGYVCRRLTAKAIRAWR